MTIIIPKDVYFTIVAAVVRFANIKIPREDWKEVSGVFTGKIIEENESKHLFISAAYPIMHDTFDSSTANEYDVRKVIDKFEYSDMDHVTLALIDEEAFSRGEFTVGWWHSHPGFLTMLSGFGDRKTTMFYQTHNPLAIALVFNPDRLMKQIEKPLRAGGPEEQLKHDPGFKIFRLEDSTDQHSNFYDVEYQIQGFDNDEEMVRSAQKLAIDIANNFTGEEIFGTYDKLIKERIVQLDSLLLGTEEYLTTLVRKGESTRISEVLGNQTREIRKFVAETFIKIENIKQLMNYLEYKERDNIIPKVNQILSEWDETISNLNSRLDQLAKKF